MHVVARMKDYINRMRATPVEDDPGYDGESQDALVSIWHCISKTFLKKKLFMVFLNHFDMLM